MPDYLIPQQMTNQRTRHLMTRPDQISDWLDKFLPNMDYPEIYASQGDELNAVHRDWDTAKLRICLVGGMTYRNSVGNLAIPLLYSELTEKGPEDWYIDRSYLWESRKNFELYRTDGVPPFGLQSRHPLSDFDILAFSCSYLQTALHVGLLLKHAGIPYHSSAREDSHPLVIVGGHHMYVNPEPIWKIPDVCFVGEFSAGGMDVFKAYQDAIKAGQKKWEWIESYARPYLETDPLAEDYGKVTQRKGFYVPSFYEETYSPNFPYPIKSKKSTVQGIPDRARKTYVSHMDTQAHIARRPIVPFVNPSMGTAEIQSSFGCDFAACTFCSEGQTNKPFRYYSVSNIVSHAKDQMKWTGMRSFTLAAFDGAGHPQKNHLLHELLENVSDNVGLLSLRVEETATDPDFAKLSTLSGNRTLSVGVEGMSDRMRRVFVKTCPEESILEVCRLGMQNGATKIKFFLICNHPWETEADRLEWVETLKKVEAIKEELGSKCEILSSWTPLVIMPHTPLQWEAPTVEYRTLHGIINAIKEQTKTKFRIGSGGRRDEAYMAQLLQLGDRRISYLVDWCVENDFVHYGATPRGMTERISMILHSIPGPWLDKGEPLDFKHYFRPRDYEEILPWDVIDINVDKAWLQMVNEVSKVAEREIPGCTTGCTACGGCTTVDRAFMHSGVSSGDVRAKPSEVKILQERGRVQVMRLKTVVDRDHRFIGPDYWQAAIIRAFRICGFPVDKSYVQMVSSRIKFYDYSFGTEYFDVGLRERQDAVKVFEALQGVTDRGDPILGYGLKLVQTRSFSPKASLSKGAGSIHFAVDVRPISSISQTKTAMERLLGAEHFITRIKVKTNKAVTSEEVDIRPWVIDAWVQENGLLHLLLLDRANPFEILPGILEAPRSKILRLDSVRVDVFTVGSESDQEDLFRPICPVTGEQIRPNLMDELHSSGLSPRARYKTIKLNPVTSQTVHSDTLSLDELRLDSDLVGEDALFTDMMNEEFNLIGTKGDQESVGAHLDDLIPVM